LELPEIADRLATPDDELIAAYGKRIEAARGEMRRFGADGVPALIVSVGDNRRIVRGSALFGNIGVLVGGLKVA
jgi:putative protein-disulfide isomerase